MASPHQKRVLLGLQAGLTLREVLREPHMPNERMLAEWRTDSRFDTEFTNASIQGAAYRAKQVANRPMAKGAAIASELNRPTVEEDPHVHLFALEAIGKALWPQSKHLPTVDEDFRIQAALEMTPIQKFINEPMFTEINALAPVADDSALKESIMQRLRNGEYSHTVMASTQGFYANKLSDWRKEPDFVTEWNKAKAVGRSKRDSDAVMEQLTTIVNDDLAETMAAPIIAALHVTEDADLSVEAGEPSIKANPVHNFLPEGLVRRYVILKAQDCYDFLMTEEQAVESAAQHSANDNMPYYIALVGHIALPTITSTIHALD